MSKNTKIQKYPLPGRGGAAGAKFRISLACPVGAVMNCADNTGHYHDHDHNDDNDDNDDCGVLMVMIPQVQRTCT